MYVVALTPSGNHSNNVVELAKFKKHIVFEKPLALNLEDAAKIIKACEKNSIRLFVVKQYRFNVPVMKMKESFDLGRFGKVFMAKVRVRSRIL